MPVPETVHFSARLLPEDLEKIVRAADAHGVHKTVIMRWLMELPEVQSYLDALGQPRVTPGTKRTPTA